MLNKQKLLSEVENVVYTSENKLEADKLMKSYISFINNLKSTNYNYSVNRFPLTLTIKHKAYSKKFILQFINGNWYLNKKLISPKNLEQILDKFFA